MGRLSASGVYMQPEIILAQLRALLERTPDFMLYTPASRDHQMWLGHAHALTSLGLMYFIGRGVPQDGEIALKWRISMGICSYIGLRNQVPMQHTNHLLDLTVITSRPRKGNVLCNYIQPRLCGC
jgi:hypothetical protein